MELRSSTISKRVSRKPYAAAPQDHNDSSSSKATNVAKSSKRVQVKKRKTREDDDTDAGLAKGARGEWGLLSKMVEMPMDVLFEIFGHLDPLDLVHMARMTKALRSILMSRSSISVWKSARSNVGLPDCPNDLTEPQYAALMFVTDCSFCHKSRALTYISWYARIRCCNRCVKFNFKPFLKSHLNEGYIITCPPLLSAWVPFIKVSIHETIWISANTDNQWKEEYMALKIPIIQHEWLLRTLEARHAIQKHARLCDLWYNARQNCTNVDEIRKIFERNAQIMKDNKLECIMLEEELSPLEPHPLDSDSFIRLYRSPSSDEERSLYNKLKKLLIVRLGHSRANRTRQERDAFFKSRWLFLSDIYNNGIKMLPITSPSPSLDQFFCVTKAHDLVDYSKTAQDALRAPFDEVVALWRKHVDSKLIELITNECGSEYVFDPVIVFDLATTVFVCRHCNHTYGYTRPMRHSQAVVHPCAQEHYHMNAEQWVASGFVTIRSIDLKLMQRVVEMCGLDPKVTNARQMDELDPIFECRACNLSEKGRATMTWAAVLRHQRVSHKYSEEIDALRLLGEPEAKKVREGIKEGQAQAILSGCRLVCMYCCYCRTPVDDLTRHRKHLRECHNHHVSNEEYDELKVYFQQNRIPPMYRLWPPLDEESDNA